MREKQCRHLKAHGIRKQRINKELNGATTQFAFASLLPLDTKQLKIVFHILTNKFLKCFDTSNFKLPDFYRLQLLMGFRHIKTALFK